MKPSCLISFFVLLQFFNVHPGQSQALNFSLVSPPVESPWGLVTGITQDRSGLMWFSTDNGVQSYDGYKITTYLNEQYNPNSLALNQTECIYADSAGIIWIGTRNAGLERLDPVTGKFSHFRHNPGDPASLIDDNIRAIFEDSEGIFWIGTFDGLDKFDKTTGKFKHYQPDKNDSATLSSGQVRAIYEDHQGILWIGTGEAWGLPALSGEGGLNRFDRKTGKFTRYMHDPKNPHSLIDNRVKAICEDSQGNFWVGTAGDGLHLMDRSKGTFERLRYDPLHPEKLSRPPLNPSPAPEADDHITFIRQDATGIIWIGTMGAGITLYDPGTQRTIHYGGNDSTGGLKEYHTYWSYMSREGVIWISCIGGSLYHADPSQIIIPLIKTFPETWLIYQADPHTLWVGTSSGLIKNDLSTLTKRTFKRDPLIGSGISNDTVYSIISDDLGALWIGTLGGGPNRYNPASQSFLHYRHSAKDNRSLDNDNVWSILKDHSSNIWAGTDSGLNMLDIKSGYFTHYHYNTRDSNGLSSPAVNVLLEDDDQNYLWVGTFEGGINRLNRHSGKFEHYLPNIFISCIIKDHDRIIWATTSEGLFKYDRKNNTFEKYIDPAGSVKIKGVAGIAEDDQHNLWIAGSAAIFRINKNRDQIQIFNKNNGVKNAAAYFSNVFKDLNGNVYFNYYPIGYYSFSPGSLIKQISNPLVLISDFKLEYESVHPGKASPISVPVNQAREINLNHKQNAFSFDFAPIHYTSTEDNRIMFKLENYDKDWRKPGAEKTVQYFNVPPGQYKFRVKAATNMGVWVEKEIIVNITPPWWATWWAYVIYAILIASALWAFILYRSRNLVKEKRILEHKVNIRTTEIMKQKEEIAQTLQDLKNTQSQLLQQEKMASLGELTAGIAHEIQNPLNFVNNFSEINAELIDEMEKEFIDGNKEEGIAIASSIKQNLEKIIHHGKRADSIVKGMLQHSRSSTGQKESTDINALADEYLRLSYHGLRAKDKTFNAVLEKHFDESIGNIHIVPQDIGRVLLNLYNNAFYAISEKKKAHQPGIGGVEFQPTVSVITKKIGSPSGGSIEIRVKDNGSGIPQKVLDKIFQPFYTTKPTGQGTGLGLSLSYDIIKAHSGEIKVENLPAGIKGEEGGGAEFIIQLPAI